MEEISAVIDEPTLPAIRIAAITGANSVHREIPTMPPILS